MDSFASLDLDFFPESDRPIAATGDKGSLGWRVVDPAWSAYVVIRRPHRHLLGRESIPNDNLDGCFTLANSAYEMQRETLVEMATHRVVWLIDG